MARIPATIRSHHQLTDLAKQLDRVARHLYFLMLRMQEGVRDEALARDYEEHKKLALELMAKIGVPGRRITRLIRSAPTLYERADFELEPIVQAARGSFQTYSAAL